jgi:ABC-type multidrug transport system ATPase subunit
MVPLTKEALSDANRILICDQGTIIFNGSLNEFKAYPKYEEYFNLLEDSSAKLEKDEFEE